MNPADQRPSPASSEAIDELAATWLVRRNSGLTDHEAIEFARWRDADLRHHAAFRRAESAGRLLARLPESPAAAAMLAEVEALCSSRQPVVPFSRLWKPAIALAAAAAVAFVTWTASRPNLASSNATYTTADGRHQSINLPDGSTFVLSSSSQIEVAFEAFERHVRLHHGEAHFYVAKDPDRPFLVTAGAVTVRAVGTAFNVRRQAAAIEVLVTEGKVEVTRQDVPDLTAGAGEPIYLVAGERVFIDSVPAPAVAAYSAEPPVSRSAQRAPRLMFNNTPLSDVVDRFNQYSLLQMEIADPDLAHRSVGGNFDADKAESFINLLSAAGDVRVEHVSATRVVLHKVQ